MIDLLKITVNGTDAAEIIFSSLYEVVGQEKEIVEWFNHNNNELLRISSELVEIYNRGIDRREATK